MILNKKQRKELPDSDYGLPDERKFPLVDADHVLKAIQFFKYCPSDKKKILAKNINRKAKELGMKIKSKGEFSKYISPDVVKEATDSGFEYVANEASNIGTLSPIVGGVPAEDEKYIENKEDFDEAVLGFSEECGFFNEYIERKIIDKWNLPNSKLLGLGRYGDLQIPERPVCYSGHNNFDEHFDSPSIMLAMRSAMNNFELDCMYDYVTNDFKKREAIFNTRKSIIEIINSKDSDDIKVSKLAVIVASHHKLSEFHFLLQTIYVMDVEICAKVIQKFRDEKFDVRLTRFNIQYIDMSEYLRSDHILKSEYSEKCPNTIINDLNYYTNYKYGNTPNKYDWTILEYLVKVKALPDRTIAGYSDIIAVQTLHAVRQMLKLNSIDWYAFIYCNIDRMDYAFYIGIDNNVYKLFEVEEEGNTRPKYIAYLIGGMEGREIKFNRDLFIPDKDNDGHGYLSERPTVITMDPWSPKYNHCTTEGWDFFNNDNPKNTIKGIHADKITAEPFFGFDSKDTTFIDKIYNSCHTMLPKNLKDKNFDDMKDNLSISFYTITTIDNDNENTDVQLDINIPHTQETKRLRSLLISDFKTYLNKLEKAEPKFDFLSYFFDNKLAGSESKDVRSLFTKSFETIRYW